MIPFQTVHVHIYARKNIVFILVLLSVITASVGNYGLIPSCSANSYPPAMTLLNTFSDLKCPHSYPNKSV